MKKLWTLLIAVVILLSLTACGNETISTNEDTSNNVVTETTDEKNENSSNEAEWKQFLKDYEDWVDNYIEITKKYEANPSDLSILTDYTEMVSELAEWSEKADEIELELKDSDAALEYSNELMRIANKLAEAAK